VGQCCPATGTCVTFLELFGTAFYSFFFIGATGATGWTRENTLFGEGSCSSGQQKDID